MESKGRIDQIFAEHLSKDERVRRLLAKLLESVRAGELFLLLAQEEIDDLEERAADLIGKSIFLEEGRLYLKRYYQLQTRFYSDLERIATTPPLKTIEESAITNLSESQAKALTSCKEHSFSMMTGGPGTGKSYTIAKIVEAFSPFLSIAIVAPTGKATARLRELLPNSSYEVMTLHRLLRMGSHEEVSKLKHDLIIVDESSMVDVTLFTKLVAGVRSGARLLLVGDHEQLPPVEGASYFRELIEKKRECVTFLQTSLRVEKSELLQLAEKAKRGEVVESESLPRPERLIDRFSQELLFLPSDSFEKLTRLKMLTPLREGPYGVKALNDRFYKRQQELYPQSAIPIMITINDEKLGIYNGDMGLWKGDEILFADGRKVNRYWVKGFELGYVLSVHKSQGSEYQRVIMLMPKGSDRFGSALLYTAITRAKESVQILSER